MRAKVDASKKTAKSFIAQKSSTDARGETYLPGRNEHPPGNLNLDRGQSAILIKNAFEFVGNIGRFPMLNIAALDHVHQFAIAKERDRR